jgi:hypothetical protein
LATSLALYFSIVLTNSYTGGPPLGPPDDEIQPAVKLGLDGSGPAARRPPPAEARPTCQPPDPEPDIKVGRKQADLL